jgi:hypothetical protein
MINGENIIWYLHKQYCSNSFPKETSKNTIYNWLPKQVMLSTKNKRDMKNNIP